MSHLKTFSLEPRGIQQKRVVTHASVPYAVLRRAKRSARAVFCNG
jgi:hypothetical protein